MKEKRFKIGKTKKGALMSNLIYPAFLGASFVWFFQKLSDELYNSESGFENLYPIITKIEYCYALWVIFYFCLMFILMTQFKIGKQYNWFLFFLDFVDVIIIFLVFYNLGFVVDLTSPNLNWVYFLLAVIPVSATINNLYTKGKVRTGLIALALTISILMGFFGYSNLFLNYVAFLFLSILLIVYSMDFDDRKNTKA